MVSRKITKIIGIALTVIGSSVFGTSYHLGSISQDKFSVLGCAVNFTPKMCAETNVVIIAGFIGMILSFFTGLFGAYLIIPSALTTMIKRYVLVMLTQQVEEWSQDPSEEHILNMPLM